MCTIRGRQSVTQTLHSGSAELAPRLPATAKSYCVFLATPHEFDVSVYMCWKIYIFSKYQNPPNLCMPNANHLGLRRSERNQTTKSRIVRHLAGGRLRSLHTLW